MCNETDSPGFGSVPLLLTSRSKVWPWWCYWLFIATKYILMVCGIICTRTFTIGIIGPCDSWHQVRFPMGGGVDFPDWNFGNFANTFIWLGGSIQVKNCRSLVISGLLDKIGICWNSIYLLAVTILLNWKIWWQAIPLIRISSCAHRSLDSCFAYHYFIQHTKYIQHTQTHNHDNQVINEKDNDTNR